MQKGVFISFEGIDGSGKTTQVEMLAEFLKNQRKNVVVTSDLKGTPHAQKLRKKMFEAKEQGKTSYEQQRIAMLARIDVVENVIIPSLNKGKIVLCDRFEGGMPYQGYGEKDYDFIEIYPRMYKNYLGNFKPDLTLLLNVPIIEIKNRLKNRGNLDVFEKDMSFLERVDFGYRMLAHQNPDRIIIIDSDKKPEVVHNKILHHLIGSHLINHRGR